MDNQINSNKFQQDEEKIKAKIALVEKELNEEISLIPEYQLLNVYNKISKIIMKDNRKFTILKKKFLFKDKTLTGYLNLKDFHDILNNNLILERDELKILLCDPILRNKINPKLYQYKPFLDKISNFDENDISKMKNQYNIEQNKYLTDLRNTILINKINLKNIWENNYKETKCTKNNFYLIFNEIKSNYSYHNLEIEYIFDLICEKGKNAIEYERFEKIMRMRPDGDLRVLYFKKVKEEKEKEEKKEEEKILINYYPNILDNNNIINNINNNNENNEDKTKYIIVKGDETINNNLPEKENNSSENSNGKNEQFILGNVNSNNNIDNKDNVNNDQEQNKTINSEAQNPEIPQNLIQNNEKDASSKTQIISSKAIHLKKYSNTIYDIKDNLLNNSTIVKNKLYFDEIKTKTQLDIDDIIKKRIDKSNEKVNYLLSQHEEYIILKLYYSLNYQLKYIDNDLLLKFKNKDSQNKNLLSFNDFISILQTDLKLNFNKDHFNMLLNSLENIDNINNLFSYEEFLKNLNSYNTSKNNKIEKIENLALVNYNLYLVDFKKFIINNKIDINNIFNAVSKDKFNLTFKEFISFCNCFYYKLSNINEYKYIFDILSKESNNNLLSKTNLNKFIDSNFIPEEKFIEDGKRQKNFGNNINKNWYKFIPKYNISNDSFNLKFMKNFEQLFLMINKQKIKFGIINFADFFSSKCNVDINGNIYKEDFIKTLSFIEIINSPKIKELLFYLEDIYNSSKFQLANFLGIFEAYNCEKNKKKKVPYNFKTYPKNPNIVFRNNYGFFTHEDMKKIKEICSNIHEVICYIKRETIFDYFTKFDLDKKGYFYLDQLECILIDDLGIYNNELINLF